MATTLKKLRRIAARIVEDPDSLSYQDFGHRGTKKSGNMLWVYHNGRVDKRPQEFLGKKGLTHDEIFWDVEEKARFPYGRYDPSQKVITLAMPKILKHRDPPGFLIDALERAFPEAEELRVFQ